MDHVVYLDAKANELSEILQGNKTMIVRGAAGRKMPHGRVNKGDILYLIENDGRGLVRARAQVLSVHHSDKLTPDESTAMVEQHQDRLRLSDAQFKRWAGKRFLVLIEIGRVVELEPFRVDKSEYGNMDDWLPVGDIEQVRIP